MKLGKAKVKMLKRWLGYSKKWKKNHCPFESESGFDLNNDEAALAKFAQIYCKNVCKVTYPKVVLTKDNIERAEECPCQVYTEAHVVRKARQVIKENQS